GMTFEGAIRALQLSNAPPRAKPAAQPTTTAWRGGLGAGKSAALASEQRPAPSAEAAEPQASTGISLATSAREFLAAARARIQQRAAARASETSSAAIGPVTPGGARERARRPSSPPVSGRGDLNPSSLAAAIRDVAEDPAAEPAKAAPPVAPAEPP